MTEDTLPEEVQELRSNVQELQTRISYLEDEVDASLYQERFENFAETTLDDVTKVTINDPWEWEAKGSLEPENVHKAIRRVDRKDGYDWWLEGEDDDIVMIIQKQV